MTEWNEGFKQIIDQLPIPVTKLAEMAECDTSTIYRIIKGHALKRHTRNRIIEALAQLGYPKEEVADVLPLEKKASPRKA